MRYIILLLSLILIGFGAASSLRAQEQGPAGAGAAPAGAGGPAAGAPDSGSGLDTTGIKSYKLGPGDVLNIRVIGHPEFNGPVAVDDDGNIEVPFIDKPIYAKCRTYPEVREDVKLALAKYIRKPQVAVTIADRGSRPPAVVFGAVRSPQRVQMFRKVRLLELLANAGGVTQAASGTIQIFHMERVMCPGMEDPDASGSQALEAAGQTGSVEARAGQQAVSVEAKAEPAAKKEDSSLQKTGATEDATAEAGDDEAGGKMMTDEKLGTKFIIYSLEDLKLGKPGSNPVIRPGDIIIVPEAAPVFVTGAVVTPMPIPIRDQLSLRYAIAQCGGLRKDAKAGDIRIYRRKPGSLSPEIIKVDYNKIRKNEQPDVALQEYDIVDVRGATFTPSNILNMLTGATASTITGGVANMAYLPLRYIY